MPAHTHVRYAACNRGPYKTARCAYPPPKGAYPPLRGPHTIAPADQGALRVTATKRHVSSRRCDHRALLNLRRPSRRGPKALRRHHTRIGPARIRRARRGTGSRGTPAPDRHVRLHHTARAAGANRATSPHASGRSARRKRRLSSQAVHAGLPSDCHTVPTPG